MERCVDLYFVHGFFLASEFERLQNLKKTIPGGITGLSKIIRTVYTWSHLRAPEDSGI